MTECNKAVLRSREVAQLAKDDGWGGQIFAHVQKTCRQVECSEYLSATFVVTNAGVQPTPCYAYRLTRGWVNVDSGYPVFLFLRRGLSKISISKGNRICKGSTNPT